MGNKIETLKNPESGLTVWRYSLPNDKAFEGWGIFLLDSTGMFAVVSDYGNYVFKWTHHGQKDFREFVVQIGWDYFCGKMGRRNHLNLERTIKGVKEDILRYRREGRWTKDEAREEWNHLKNHDLSDPGEQSNWFWNSRFADDPDLFCYDYSPQLEHFSKKLLPRLQEVIVKQLQEERHQCHECVSPSGRKHDKWCLQELKVS